MVEDDEFTPELSDEEIVDEVAIRRALLGDRDVWNAMTRTERRETLRRVRARRQAELSENREWLRVAKTIGGSRKQYVDEPSFLPHEHTRYPDWLVQVAVAFDRSPATLLNAARRRERPGGSQ